MSKYFNWWVEQRTYEVVGYRKFRRELKLKIINEWRVTLGKKPLYE